MTTNGIYINSDAWNFWTDQDLSNLDREGLVDAIQRDVDFYVSGGGVAAVLYNMNFQRVFFPTRAGTPYWKDLSFAGDGALVFRGKPLEADWERISVDGRSFATMLRNALRMNREVPDFMARRYDFCHRRGAEMWHSMRMDDVHHTHIGGEGLPQHCDLWLDRKDLLRAWYRHTWRWDWRDNALDYGKSEVFDAQLALMREYVLEYESDGIELDWLRCLPVFAPGSDERNAPLLTRFLRETRAACREAAAKWGHPLRVGVRVPARVREAYGTGLDVGAWAREGLVDLVVPSCKDTLTEQDCDLAIYRALCPAPIQIAPDLDYQATSDAACEVRLLFDADIDCGFASGWYHDGADTVYAYNHFPRHAREDHPGYPGEFAYLGDREAVAAHARRHVFTGHRPTGEGHYFMAPYPDFVWAKCGNGGVKVNCGERTAGRRAQVVLGMKVPANLDVRVNTVPCAPMPADSPLPARMPGGRAEYRQYAIPDGVLHDGWNNVEFFNRGKADLAGADFAWLEIDLAAQGG